jgi:MGT family glycosyltransferase
VRILVAATDSPGHGYPAIALAHELHARGREVLMVTTADWGVQTGHCHEVAKRIGLRIMSSEPRAAEADSDAPGRALAGRARRLVELMREFRPRVVVSDVVAPAPRLAAERAGLPHATLIPMLYPVQPPGFVPEGFRRPRTPVAAGMWRAVGPALRPLRDIGRSQRGWRKWQNEARAELGLPLLERGSNWALGDGLVIVATLPQLEYPRRWPEHVHVTGPMLLDLPHPEVELPGGEEPLVLVNSSTSQDPELRLVRTALEALAGEPVRVVATMSQPGQPWGAGVPDNATVADWVPYEQVMPRTSLVVCGGGHGMVTRPLQWGAPVLVVPGTDEQAENGARAAWAGAGLTLPRRLLAPGPLRWAVRRMLAEPRFAERARGIAAWARDNDGVARGADLVEAFARGAA